MKIQVLCGMIASCKTSYSKNAALKGVICMSDDAIVNMIHADQYNLYNPDLKILYKSIENHIISTAISMNKIVLIDRGLNISPKGRKRWISLAKSFEIPIEAILTEIEDPEIHAQRRFKNDPRGLDISHWQKVAKEHFMSYVEPTCEEGFDRIYKVSFEEIKNGKVFL